MNTFSTDVPIRLKACSGKGSQSALSSLLCISFPTLSSADPLWFLTPLGWAREERGQKPERSYLTEMVVNCFFCPHCFGMCSKLTLCGLLLWAVLKSFCFSLQMLSLTHFNLLLPQMVDRYRQYQRASSPFVICLSLANGEHWEEISDRQEREVRAFVPRILFLLGCTVFRHPSAEGHSSCWEVLSIYGSLHLGSSDHSHPCSCRMVQAVISSREPHCFPRSPSALPTPSCFCCSVAQLCLDSLQLHGL